MTTVTDQNSLRICLSEVGYNNRFEHAANQVHRFVNSGEFSRCGRATKFDCFVMGEKADWTVSQTCRECFREARDW